MGCRRPNARTIAKEDSNADPFRAGSVCEVLHARYAVCAATCDVRCAGYVVSTASRGGERRKRKGLFLRSRL